MLFAAIKSKDAWLVSGILSSLGGRAIEEEMTADVERNQCSSYAQITDINLGSRNEEGHTFLGIACENGSDDIVELLIQVLFVYFINRPLLVIIVLN